MPIRKSVAYAISIGVLIPFIYITSLGYTSIHNLSKLKENQIYNEHASYNKCGYGSNGPRILCAVFTHAKNYENKATAVNNTWGKRCDKTIFMSGIHNATVVKPAGLNLINLNFTEDYFKLTDKTIKTILYSYENLIDQFDWILKADDDTYVLVENLKSFLSTKCNDDLKTYGFSFKPHAPERFTYEFNSGGAGYLLSNKAVRIFSQKYANDKSYCRNNTGTEDADLQNCLNILGIYPGDSRDKNGKERFHPLSFQNMWSLQTSHWTFKHSKNPIKTGKDCCSESSISFHYTSNEEMYQLDFLLYNLAIQSYRQL